MIIKEGDIILYRFLPGYYQFQNQAEIDELKNVYDEDFNIIHTKDNITKEWEIGDINWFAGQHIEKYYPLWKQSNITREGGDALTTMNTFIDAVRAWANQETLPDPWDGTLEDITP